MMSRISIYLTYIFSIVWATIVPDVTNKTVVTSLAELAGNAYHNITAMNSTSWRNTTGLWNYDYSYGWSVDGLRGHVFSHVDDDVIVVSVKGTSLNSAKDKESANLICSCNCCYANCTNACDRDNLISSLPNMYLSLLLVVVEQIKRDYLKYSIWFTGHSMGAVIASLAGVRTCNPAIGFASPGEQLFANRIDLRHKCPDDVISPIYHIGYHKDPIFVGNCGLLCNIAGYRMDSKCHHGRECVYRDATDDDEDDGDDQIHDWGSGLIYTHTIGFLIDKVILPANTVPKCAPVTNCTETCNDGEQDDN